MVVIAIVALMSVSVVIGFRAFGQNIQVKETASVIESIVQQLEPEISRGEYQKHHVYFHDNFLIVDSEPQNTTLKLNYKGVGEGNCAASSVSLEVIGGPEAVYLHKKNRDGHTLEIQSYKNGATLCIDFMKSEEIGLHYQTHSQSEHSNAIRLYHFNLNRHNPQNDVKLSSGTDYELEIQGPYGKKMVYKNGNAENGPINLIVANEEGEESTVNLN